jgi:phosphoribosylaminoimidazole carboxylase PurE protein
MNDTNPQVAIVVGSKNDWPVMDAAKTMLEKFGIAYETKTSSAHRNPDETSRWSDELAARGIQIVICGAGYAAHLAGAVAGRTTLPVLGVPIDASPLNGLDALLSTVMMPSGVPVATLAIGKTGAKNAGVLAAQIIALSNPDVAERMRAYKRELAGG